MAFTLPSGTRTIRRIGTQAYVGAASASDNLAIDPALLAPARQRLGPEVELYETGMADFALERRFDVVTCLFGATSFLVSPENFRRPIAAMARHLAPAGVLLVEPWPLPTQYWRNRIN
jgi:hypothetical protein